MQVPNIKVGQVVDINYISTLPDGKKEDGFFSGRVQSVEKRGHDFSRFSFEGTSHFLLERNGEIAFMGGSKGLVTKITVLR